MTEKREVAMNAMTVIIPLSAKYGSARPIS